MTDLSERSEAPVQLTAHATDYGSIVQVGGDYLHEEHVHTYTRGWQFLRAVPADPGELDFAQHAYAVGDEDRRERISMAQRLLHADGSTGRGVLVLLGEPGTGRRTTALHLLASFDLPSERICELALDWEQPRLEQVPRTPGHGFVLDLSAYSELPESIYGELAAFDREARAAGCVLLLLVTGRAWRPGADPVPVLALSRVSARDVAQAHLDYSAAERTAWLTGEDFLSVLPAEAPPAQGARLARIITRVDVLNEQRARELARDQFTDWHTLLIEWFRRHGDVEHLPARALLISAALLNRQPAVVVLDAADELYQSVRGPLLPGGALGGPDIDVRIEEINAVVRDDALVLDDQYHELDRAVLAHVWRQRPQLRADLLEWASAITAQRGVAEDHVRQVARALTSLALGPGGRQVLPVITGWVENGTAAHQRLAQEILADLADSPALGVDIRDLLYDWATHKRASDQQRLAVAHLCAGTLGRKYPRIALTRLRHLAARDDPRIATALQQAIRTLADNPELRDLVVREIVGWTRSSEQATRSAGAIAFLALVEPSDHAAASEPGAEPEPSGDSEPDDLLIEGWRAATGDPATADRAHSLLTRLLDAPEEELGSIVQIAEAVFRERLGHQGVAPLLAAPDGISALSPGRRQVIERLLNISGHQPGPAARNPDSAET